ncbi:FG-GAP-like repeat-containing protein [Pseudomonadota bacterium]
MFWWFLTGIDVFFRLAVRMLQTIDIKKNKLFPTLVNRGWKCSFSAFTLCFSICFTIIPPTAFAGSFFQTDWSDGIPGDGTACTTAGGDWVNSECLARDPGDQTGWAAYFSKNTDIIEVNSGLDLELGSVSSSNTQTSQADFTPNNNNAKTHTTKSDFSSGEMLSNVYVTHRIVLGVISHVPTWTTNAGWSMGDIGTRSALAIGDLDGDGDLDVMAGQSTGTTKAYKNTGSATSPSWSYESNWDVSDLGSSTGPALADLDGDDDLDLLIGEFNGVSFGYRNTGTIGPIWEAESDWDTVDVGLISRPTFVNLGGDDDFDLVIGYSGGSSLAYENTGGTSSPTWTNQDAWDLPYAGASYSSPSFADMDFDGDQDALVGNRCELIQAYENQGSDSSPNWQRKTEWEPNLISSDCFLDYGSPALADLDQDGDIDLLFGRTYGQVDAYENIGTTTYESSGTVVSSVIDTEGHVGFDTLDYTATEPANTTLTIDIRAGDSITIDGTWTAWLLDVADGGDISSLGGKQYFQYRINLSNSVNTVTPRLDDITVNYLNFPSGSNTYASPLGKLLLSTDWTPSTIGSYSNSRFLRNIFVSGNYLYGAYQSSFGPKLRIYDISNISSPTYVTQVAYPVVPGGGIGMFHGANDVFVSGNYAYVTLGDAGLDIVDITTPSSPSSVGMFDTGGAACNVFVAGTIAYIADFQAGLQVIDVSNPVSPAFLGWADTDGNNCNGLYVSGSYLYLSDGDEGLSIFDVSDPSKPSKVFKITGTTYDVWVDGNYAYLVGTNLRVYDISNPSLPSLVATNSTIVEGTNLFFENDLLYVIDGGVLKIVDVADPGSPGVQASHESSLGDVHVVNGIIYAGTTDVKVMKRGVYQTPAELVAAVMDMGEHLGFTTLDYTVTIPANTALTVDVRAGSTSVPDGSWSSWIDGIADGGSIAALPAERYFQYRVNMSTTDTDVSPSLDDITVNVDTFSTSSALTSSPYDTGNSSNLLAGISWNETLPASTDIHIQLRTAADDSGSPGVWSSWFGPDSTSNSYWNSANTTAVASGLCSGSGSISCDPAAIARDLTNDQWLQYKVEAVTTDPDSTPIFSDVTLSYGTGVAASGQVVISQISGLTTSEAGGTDSFTIQLNSSPSADVVIDLYSSDVSEGTISQNQLVFNSGNWNSPETIVITGVTDEIDDGAIGYNIVIGSTRSSDGSFNNLNPSNVSVTNSDDDTIGITVNSFDGIATTENGTIDSFTIVLDSEPTANVTIGISSDDTTEATVDKSSLVFTSANWNIVQTVYVTGVNDDAVDGNISYNVVIGAAVSGDGLYNTMNPTDLSATNDDNDVADVIITPGGLTTTEKGGGAAYTVKLAARPDFPVSFSLSSSDTSEGYISLLSQYYTFQPDEWNAGKLGLITGINDGTIDPAEGYFINISTIASADPKWSGVSPTAVPVTNVDDDSYTITVTQLSESATTEAGGFAEFVIRLSTTPNSDVTIPLSVTDATEATVVSSITFTPSDLPWTGKSLFVYGVDDRELDGSANFDLVIGETVTDDTNFQNIDLADIPLTNFDDEVKSSVIVSGATEAESGWSVASGDFNNDNIPDLLVGAPEDVGEGKARVYFGSVSGYSNTPDWTADGSYNINLGTSVAAGDFNNDGYDDVVIGAEYETGDSPSNEFREGRVYVYYGSASGLPDADSDDIAQMSDANWVGESDQTSAYFGFAVAVADVNNDTYADLITSAYYYDNDQSNEGRVYVFHGSATGLSYTDCAGFADGVSHPCDANWIAEGDFATGRFGVSVAGAGDVNGDNIDDIIIGSDYYENGTSDEGRALVYYGSGSGLPYTDCDGAGDGIARPCEAAWKLESNIIRSFLGHKVAGAGDVNNDGYDDVVVGAPHRYDFSDRLGTAYLFYGSSTGLSDADSDGLASPSDADWQVDGVDPYDYIGAAIAGGFDFNGDNIDDVALGARGDGVGGKVFVYYGSQATGLSATADWQFIESDTDFRLSGYSVAGIADYDNDGYDEIVVGAPETTVDVFKEGAVKIFTPDINAPGFVISPTSGLQTTESAGIASFTVKLTAFPDADVTLGLSSLDTDEGTVSHSSLIFTQENWSAPQTVTITGVNDGSSDGNQPYVIETAPSTSADPDYDNIDPVDISVTNIDNDVPQEITIASNGSIDESTGTGTFTFSRAGEITAGLTINYTVSGTATGGDDYVALPGSVTIPVGSASVDINVVPTTNSVIEPDETVIVDIDSGAGYLIGTPSSATVTIVDDDTAGIIVNTVSTLTTEAGGTASFTVKLNSEPSDNVTIAYSSDDSSEGLVHPASLIFKGSNWYIPQTLTVVGQVDGIVDTDVEYTVSAVGATSNDDNYSGLVGPEVTLTNQDDGSRATISLAVSESVVDEASSGSASFVVSRTGVTTDSLNVFYTVLGSATSSADYIPIDNIVTIPAGESSVDINVFPVQDVLLEPIETVILNLANSSDYVVANPASATVMITDDESPIPPTVNFILDQVVGEGDSFTVIAELDAEGSSYPVTIPFTVGGTTENPSDHNVVAGNVVIASGTAGSSSIFTTVDDGAGEGDESIIFTMGMPVNALAGANTLHTVILTETNVKPEVTLGSEQLAVATRLVVTGAGNVTVTATVDDPNPSDSHSYDWNATNNNLTNIPESGTDDPATFIFDPSGLSSGFYAVRTTVTDDGVDSLFSDTELLLEVVASAPTLSSSVDSDGDSVMDADESFDDTDGDGIPDYLDSSEFASNELQILSGENESHIMRTEVGLVLKLGETAFAAGADGALVSVDDIDLYGGGEGQSGTASANDTVVNIGGYFDFEVAGLETAGQSVKVIIPQLVALPASAAYRKYHPDTGWDYFVEDVNNSLMSAAGSPGECPLAGSDQYLAGLNEGHYCVQLTIQDGGSNDMDGDANYVVQDPGQFAQIISSDDSSNSSGSSAGSSSGNSSGSSAGSSSGNSVTSATSGGGAMSGNELVLLVIVLSIAASLRKRAVSVIPIVGFSFVLVPQEIHAEFSLNFTPQTGSAYMAEEYYWGSGTMQTSDCAPNCTPFLLDEQIDNSTGIEQPEIVFDPTTNSSYIHMIVGSLESGFIQESYVEIVNNTDCFGGYCWARGAYDGDTTSFSTDGWGNSVKPLDSNPAFSGSGTANPNRVLIHQIVNDGEMTSQFLKDKYDKKPAIAQTIFNSQIQMTTLIDMRNSDYDTDFIEGVVINTMSLLGSDAPFDSAEFNSLIDSQDAVVNAGKFKYIEGAGTGGASGTYEYVDGTYDTMSIDWVDYFDANDASNVWSVSDFIPE